MSTVKDIISNKLLSIERVSKLDISNLRVSLTLKFKACNFNSRIQFEKLFEEVFRFLQMSFDTQQVVITLCK